MKLRWLLFLIVTAATLVAWNAATERDRDGGTSGSGHAVTSVHPGLAQLTVEQRAAIDDFVRSLLLETRLVSGLSLAVVVGAEVVFERGFGLADRQEGRPVIPHTLFYVASLAKAFTGMTAATMAAADELDLDAPLVSFFPGLMVDGPIPVGSATVRDLLRHAKGYTNGAVNYVTTYVGPIPESELVRVLNDHSSPAEGFVYANTNHALASEVISKAAGRSWRDVMAERVFRPLGMERSTAYRSEVADDELARPYRAHSGGFEALEFPKTNATITGAGGIFSSAHELAHFVIAQLNEGRVDGRQALPSEAVSEAQRPQIRLQREFFEYERFAYGLGLYHARWQGDLLLHHFGGFPGFRSHLSFMPEHGIGVVVLQNEGQSGSAISDIVASYVYDTLLGRDAAALARDRVGRLKEAAARNEENRSGWMAEVESLSYRPETPTLPLSSYEGSYRNIRLGTLQVRAEGDRLWIEWGDLDGPALPTGGNDFLIDWNVGGAPDRFTFAVSANRVTGFDWGGRPFDRVAEAGRTQE